MRWIAGIAVTLVVLWIVLIVILLLARPAGLRAGDAARLVPDLVRLVRNLLRDRTIARRLRVELWVLTGYLVMPIDLVPDFVPIVGWADDVVLCVLVLRHVARRAGRDALERNWNGSEPNFTAVTRLLGV